MYVLSPLYESLFCGFCVGVFKSTSFFFSVLSSSVFVATVYDVLGNSFYSGSLSVSSRGISHQGVSFTFVRFSWKDIGDDH